MSKKEFDPMNIKHEFDPSQKYKLDPYNMKIYTKDQYVQDCIAGLPNQSMLETQWEELPDANIGYDSMADTLKHIKRVSTLLSEAGMELIRRGTVHDESKLSGVEKEGFDKWTPLLSGAKYGSDEYKNFLTELKVSLDHHYKHNTHHPEHYENGVDGFDLFDLLEMFFDWKAATERTKQGNIYNSIEYNKERFKLSDQVCNIFINTAERMGYEKPTEDGQ
jgi:hypothetical protein